MLNYQTKCVRFQNHTKKAVGGFMLLFLFFLGLGAIPVALAAVPPPTLDFKASPSNITRGEVVALSWYATDAIYCIGSGDWEGFKHSFGSESRPPVVSSVYAISCVGQGGKVSSEIRVIVDGAPIIPPFPPPIVFPVTPSPTPLPPPPSNSSPLVASCVADPRTIHIGEAATFVAGTAGGVAPLRYAWSGAVSGNTSVQKISFTENGVKEARITIFDARGNTANAACSVTVIVNTPVSTTVSVSKQTSKTTQTASVAQSVSSVKNSKSVSESKSNPCDTSVAHDASSQTSDSSGATAANSSSAVAAQSDVGLLGGFMVGGAFLLMLIIVLFVYYFL